MECSRRILQIPAFDSINDDIRKIRLASEVQVINVLEEADGAKELALDRLKSKTIKFAN
jgi:hypothetical protein